MRIQRIGLIGQIGECVINPELFDIKPSAKTWLINPDLAHIGGIGVIQSPLKIIHAHAQRDCFCIAHLNTYTGIGIE